MIKKKPHTYLTMLGLLLCICVYAQKTSSTSGSGRIKWTTISLASDGQNLKEGVEVSMQLTKCNGEDVVFLRFINRNSRPVKIEWNDALFSKELHWTSKTNMIKLKSLTLNPYEVIEGECINKIDPQLVMKAKDFIENAHNSQSDEAVFFNVTF